MKIETDHRVEGVLRGAQKTQRSGTGVTSFDDLLHQEMGGLAGNMAVPATGALEGHGISMTQGPTANAWAASPAMQAMGGALERLAAVCSNAFGGSVDLHAMGQMLTDLGQAAEEVLERTQTLQDDHPVRRMAQEARVLAYVESIKWRRGDYV